MHVEPTKVAFVVGLCAAWSLGCGGPTPGATRATPPPLVVPPARVQSAAPVERSAEDAKLSDMLAVLFGERALPDEGAELPNLPALAAPGATDARCTAGDADACLLLGVARAPKGALYAMTHELRGLPCPAKSIRCYTRHIGKRPVKLGDAWGDDAAGAAKALERACMAHRAGACIARWQIARHLAEADAKAWLLVGCLYLDASLACAPAIVEGELLDDPDGALAGRIRTKLGERCIDTQDARRAVACNALAFLEERAVGGAAAPAHAVGAHLTACGLGSSASCTHLLLADGPRPPPPPELTGERLEALLRGRCDPKQHASSDPCLALAAALETGWVVNRDPKAAKVILNEVCDGGRAEACVKIGRKTP